MEGKCMYKFYAFLTLLFVACFPFFVSPKPKKKSQQWGTKTLRIGKHNCGSVG